MTGPDRSEHTQARIAVIGNTNADHIYRVHGALGPGQEILAEDLGLRLGGSGANSGSWLATVGDDVHLYGSVGGDDRGHRIWREWTPILGTEAGRFCTTVRITTA